MRRFDLRLDRHWVQPLQGFLFAILLLGILLRTFQFPNIPPGLFVDEAGAGYETFSLLHTGADRWGIPRPVYFISWGSGQSVLYSYLSMPIVAVLGLSRFSIRLLSWFIGILTLPLLYVAVKRIRGRDAALLSTLLLAILPWHITISRWALDANLLPFFLLLGTYTIARALESKSRTWILVAWLPWGLALYAYAMAYVVVPILLLLVLIFYRQTILKNWQLWVGAFALFALIAIPIVLFLVKNFIVQDTLAIERFLPFGIPLLPISRLAQVASPLPERLLNTFFFVVSGFQDGEVRNSVLGVAPTFLIFFPLALVGAAYLKRAGRADLFLLSLVACLPLFLTADPAINRVNAVFIPMLVVAVYGLLELRRRLGASGKILGAAFTVLIAIQALVFAVDYNFVYPTVPDVQLAFFQGFERAIGKGLAVADSSENILVTDQIVLPYILTAFYAGYPPDQYQREIKYTTEYGAINVRSFGRFYFGKQNLPDLNHPFTYVLAKSDPNPCPNPEAFLDTRLWKVGKCAAR